MQSCLDNLPPPGRWARDGSLTGPTGIRLIVAKAGSTWLIEWPLTGRRYGRFPSRKSARACAEEAIATLAGGRWSEAEDARRCAGSMLDSLSPQHLSPGVRLTGQCEAPPFALHPSLESTMSTAELYPLIGIGEGSKGDLVRITLDRYNWRDWHYIAKSTCFDQLYNVCT